MQKCCSEDRPLDVVPPGTGTKVANAGNRNGSRQCREQERKRVVLPPPTLPKNVIAVLTRAGEHSGRRRSGGLLFHLVCAQETEWGELSKQRKQWISLAQKLKKIFLCKIEQGFYITANRNREDTGDQATEEFAHGRNFCHHV